MDQLVAILRYISATALKCEFGKQMSALGQCCKYMIRIEYLNVGILLNIARHDLVRSRYVKYDGFGI